MKKGGTNAFRITRFEAGDAEIKPGIGILRQQNRITERCRISDVGCFLKLRKPAVTQLTQAVDRAIARQRDQPGNRAGARGVKAGRLVPDRDKCVLQRFLRILPFGEDTKADTK